MSKTTYWLADSEGTLAPVEGAEARDHLTRVQGWTEAAEPGRHDKVWLHNVDHPELGGMSLDWEAAQLDAWAGRGWKPGLPLASGGVAPEPKTAPTTKPGSAGDKKEQA